VAFDAGLLCGGRVYRGPYCAVCATAPVLVTPSAAPCHFFQPLLMPAYFDAYCILLVSSDRMYVSITARALALIQIFAGSVTVMIWFTASLGKYSVVRPGKPNTIVKSFSFSPVIAIDNDFFGW